MLGQLTAQAAPDLALVDRFGVADQVGHQHGIDRVEPMVNDRRRADRVVVQAA